MPHFKDKNGGLFWLDAQDVAQWKRTGWTQISNAEAEAIREAQKPPPDRAAEIAARLQAIDADSVRALRVAIVEQAGGRQVPAFEKGKLAALETEAAALRAELATLGA